jgi:aspartate racemase
MASAYFYEMLTRMQAGFAEQNHLDILLYSKPSTPDRSAFITGTGADPITSLVEAGRVLEAAGVTVIAIPCVTTHFLYDRLARAFTVPVLNILWETVADLLRRGIGKAGLLATDGTVNGRIFHNIMAENDIECITPGDESQRKLMQMIYAFKKQETAVSRELIMALAEELSYRGAQTVILGCTELSVITRNDDLPPLYTDAAALLARAALKACGVDVCK